MTKKSSNTSNQFDYYQSLNDSLDEISRRQGVDVDLMDEVKPMSTGTLILDMILGGGIRPAMYTSAGWEQSCKTTGALSIMSSAIKQGVPLISHWDFEGSSANSKPYIANIFKTMGIKTSASEVFGKRDPNSGEWIIKPTVRYNSETSGEKFFNWFSTVLREMPDKKYVAHKWWLVYEDTKVNKAKLAEYAVQGMNKKYGKGIWIEAPDGKLQGIVLVDSYPAMNPDSNDEEEADRSLGVHARFFAKHLPRIKGRLARKMVALIGINQLRDIPMAMYGPKEQEACGKALRFQSDARLWWTSRSSGMPFNPKFDTEEKLEIEDSYDKQGKDRYRYIQINAKKNKLSQPGRKHWVRLWVQDANGEARGFDPVFDTAHYLKETGQLLGKRDKLILNLRDYGKAKKPIKWNEFKRLILGSKEDKIKICESLGYKGMDVRLMCFRQIASGKAENYYIEQGNNKASTEED